MKTLRNERDRREVRDRLTRLRADSQRRWGQMSAHQMICHLSDSFRSAMGEKPTGQNSPLFKRTVYKWVALWGPLAWPHNIDTRPELNQQQGGTQPVEFASDVDAFHRLFRRYCTWEGNFAPHAWMGRLSRT